MSAVEAQKVSDVPVVAPTEVAAPAPVEPVVADKPAEAEVEAPKAEEPKVEGEVPAAAEEKKEEEKPEAKAVEPIYSGALGYKAPGLKNAFRFSKKYFWFGEEAVPAANLREYLRGEKPEIAHSVAAWSSQTGKGLLYFVKHADQKEHPAGVLNLAYATDLAKDGAVAFAFKISGHKHTFEAQTVPERDGWFVAVEKAITEAKASKDTIESSEGYKEEKEKIGKPVPLAAASASAPKKSLDATPKLAEAEAPATEEAAAPAPARVGSSSGSSSDEDKKAKKAKSKSRSVSRKRASIFGGLLGKKDKPEEKAEKKEEGEAAKVEPEVKDETAAPAEASTAAPIAEEAPKVEEVKTDAAAPATEEAKPEEAAKTTEEKPKPTKRGSIFGTVFAKLASPTHEKKEHEIVPPATSSSKDAPAEAKPLEEAQVAAPTEPVAESALKTEEPKPAEAKPAVTPSKEQKDHFNFGRFFGNKDRAKSPAAPDKTAEPTKVDAVAPQIEDPAAPAAEATEPVAPVEPKAEAAEEKKEETTPVKKEKKNSIFGSLGRTLSKAANKNKESPKEKKETAQPTTVAEETTESADKTAAPVEEKKEEAASPAEKTIGDVVPEAVTVGEAPKSNPTVTSTA